MRVLFLHADSFSYHVTGETSITKQLDPIPEELMKGSAEEVLVCMIAVEKDDSQKPGIITNAVSQIVELCKQINAKAVMLYPYAHLSSSLEIPRAAVHFMEKLYESLSKVDWLKVIKAPFGVYKGFSINVKGHPLSELGRTITDEGAAQESSSLKAETEKKSEWFVMTPEGQMCPLKDFDMQKYPALNDLLNYEIGGSRLSEEAPPHIKLMQEHELVDYEPGSDAGNFRWYPKGYTIKKLLEEQVTMLLNQYGAMQVETPIMYDYKHPALAKYLDKFPARQYTVISEKQEYFLRFAACFGQYLIKHDMKISYKNLPIRLYELTHYSFRREKSGELVGLKRLRTFTMPDMHTLCADVPQAKQEMLNQVNLSFGWMDNLGYNRDEYSVALRVVKSFYEENPDYVKEIAKRFGRPILVEVWNKQYFYFVTKFEVNFIDNQKKASALCTVQIDVENPKSFGITYTDKEGEQNHPLMLHTSVSGSIDRNVYALLEQQARNMTRGEKANFPFWLAPTQIRIIPVKEAHHEFSIELAKKLKGRVDVDDRSDTVSKRIRSAETEWVPWIIVTGDKEAKANMFPVRMRESGKEELMSVDDINQRFEKEMAGKVWRPINLPKLLSIRPIFRG